MGRPITNTVEYFPHFAKHGKTLTILAGRFGNDGIAAWWALLEILASTENHYYDARDEMDWNYLISCFRVEESKAESILNLLAKMKAIDPELWSIKVLWCQNFVENLRGVYGSRHRELPQRPSFFEENNSIGVDTPKETPQSKVKYSKEEKSRVENRKVKKRREEETAPVGSALSPSLFLEMFETKAEKTDEFFRILNIIETEQEQMKWVMRIKAGLPRGQSLEESAMQWEAKRVQFNGNGKQQKVGGVV